MFSFRTQPPIGLSISDVRVAAVQLSGTLKQHKITALSLKKLAKDVVRKGEVLKRDELALAQLQITVHQLIQRGLLPRVLAVAQAPVDSFVPFADHPRTLAVAQRGIAEGDGHFPGEMVVHHGTVGGCSARPLTHASPPLFGSSYYTPLPV